jgi:hypothetical protein
MRENIIFRKISGNIITGHLKTGMEPIPEISFIEMSLTVLQKPDMRLNGTF